MSTPNTNSKSLLAKALASENISVQFDPSAKTACFDIANRVLKMPVLKENENECVTDMFIGHECAHALFSPYREKDKKSQGNWWIEAEEIGGTGNAPYVQDIMNIVEDVRIEKLMVDKFPGLRRDFSAAYRELESRNFFGTKNQNIDDFGFVDRMNLHFKCGATMNVQFTEDEQRIVDMVSKIETHDEVVSASREIFKFLQAQSYEARKVRTQGESTIINGGDEEGGGFVMEGNGNPPTQNPNGEKEMSLTNGQRGGTGLAPDELLPPIRTQKEFDKNSQSVRDDKVRTYSNVTLPEPDLKKIIFPINKTQEVMNAYYTGFGKRGDNGKLIGAFKQSFNDLMKSMNPLVSTLIKQFEMKKAADLQKRTSVSRTGKIDCDRIFKYKVTDDIFSRFAKITEGKNHGLVMYVDWSSSMQAATDDVLTQILMLTQFCRRMNIPFDVYLFSSQFDMMTHYGVEKEKNREYEIYKNKGSSNTHYRDHRSNEKGNCDGLHAYTLVHILSSSMRKNQMNDALFNMYLLGKMTTGNSEEFGLYPRANRGIPSYFGQGNTPLDPTILAAMYMVPEFQAKHKVQIVNTIFLTDGDSGYAMFGSYSENCHYSSNSKCSVRSPINKKEYLANDATSTDTLLRMFRDITGSTTIGFFVCATSTCRYTNDDSKELKKKLKEVGFIEAAQMKPEMVYDYNTRVSKLSDKSFNNHGYDRLFILPAKVEITDSMEDLNNLDGGATLTRIRNTFMKSVEKRGNSRSFLNRFADVIANPNAR